jgi:hypothetical protein
MMDHRPQWFAPKRYGFGAGLPVSWQGWLVLAAYIAIVVAAGILLDGKRLAQGAIVIPATIALVIIFARTTRGGWRWRWGDKD